MPNFLIRFFGTAYRGSHFFTQKLPVTATQPVNRYLHIRFAHAKAVAEFRIRTRRLFAAKKPFQSLEQWGSVRGAKFHLQPAKDLAQQSQCPLTLKSLFGRHFLNRFPKKTIFRIRIKRDLFFAAATLKPVGAVP